jgi:hypothetical protein
MIPAISDLPLRFRAHQHALGIIPVLPSLSSLFIPLYVDLPALTPFFYRRTSPAASLWWFPGSNFASFSLPFDFRFERAIPQVPVRPQSADRCST